MSSPFDGAGRFSFGFNQCLLIRVWGSCELQPYGSSICSSTEVFKGILNKINTQLEGLFSTVF
jgi:hypothetical protein